MDLKHLQSIGAFAPKTIFKRDITITFHRPTPAESWESPDVPEYEDALTTEPLTTFIRKRNSQDFMDVMGADKRDRLFVNVLRCVCHEDGTPVFATLDEVIALQDWLFVPLLNAVNEVNDFAAKKSKPRTSSGAPSRSPSAAGASRSGRSQSRKKSAPSG